MVSYKKALQIKADRQPTILEELGLDQEGYKRLSTDEKKIRQLVNKLNTSLQVDQIVASLDTLEGMVKKDAQIIYDDVAGELASFARQGIDVKNAGSLNFAYSLLEERYRELGSWGYAGKLARIKALATKEETFTGIVKQRSSALHEQLEQVLEREVRKVEEYLTGSLRKVLSLASEIMPFSVNVQNHTFKIELDAAMMPEYLVGGNDNFQRSSELYHRAIIGQGGIKIYDPKAYTYDDFEGDHTTRREGASIIIGSPLCFPLIKLTSSQQSLSGFYGLSTPFPINYSYKVIPVQFIINISTKPIVRTLSLAGPRTGMGLLIKTEQDKKVSHWLKETFSEPEGEIEALTFVEKQREAQINLEDSYAFVEVFKGGGLLNQRYCSRFIKYRRQENKVRLELYGRVGITADWAALAEEVEPLFVFPQFKAEAVKVNEAPEFLEILQAYAHLPAAIIKTVEQAYQKTYLQRHPKIDVDEAKQNLDSAMKSLEQTSSQITSSLNQGQLLLTSG